MREGGREKKAGRKKKKEKKEKGREEHRRNTSWNVLTCSNLSSLLFRPAPPLWTQEFPPPHPTGPLGMLYVGWTLCFLDPMPFTLLVFSLILVAHTTSTNFTKKVGIEDACFENSCVLKCPYSATYLIIWLGIILD